MARRWLQRVLLNLLFGGPDVPAVLVAEGTAPADLPVHREAPVLPAAGARPPAHVPGGQIAVPRELVDERENQIVAAMEAAKILPDVACIIALRRVHNAVIENNQKTNWMLDAPVQGKPS